MQTSHHCKCAQGLPPQESLPNVLLQKGILNFMLNISWNKSVKCSKITKFRFSLWDLWPLKTKSSAVKNCRNIFGHELQSVFCGWFVWQNQDRWFSSLVTKDYHWQISISVRNLLISQLRRIHSSLFPHPVSHLKGQSNNSAQHHSMRHKLSLRF